MELVSFVKEALQGVAERAASYRPGQTALRYMDRALWIVEKSARWAVPPPLDHEERPQPELTRPLPWVFFLALLVVLRIARESISLVNMALGRPPLRSADVVTYIQSKRRYLRTLKYQGNRMMRARSEPATRESWFSHLQSLFEFTMCFRRQHYGNNNTQLSNGDEVLVVKRGGGMERLLESMLRGADSDDSSACTLTNITNPRSDKSDYNTESDQEVSQQANSHTEESTNSSVDGDVPRDNASELPNDVYSLDSRIIDTKEISVDFITNEMNSHIEQIINSQRKIANGRTTNNAFIKERSADGQGRY